MSRFLNVLLASTLLAGPAMAEKIGLGRAALPEEITAWDIDVRPDGQGLPEGSGSVADGEELFSEKCAVCHGEFGEGVDNWPKLSGGQGTLDRDDPDKTIGSYWPYLSTAFDYVHRAMPFGQAQTLAADEVYAIVAYILYNNDLVEDDFVLSRENFTEVVLPNAEGFFFDDRDQTEVPAFTVEPCMENCKEKAEVTMRAAVLDVTPDDPTDDAATLIAAAAPAPEPAASPAPVSVAVAKPPVAAGYTISTDPALISAGEKVFKTCASCHKIGEGAKNATGPIMTGIVGRQAGTIEGFKYSKPMQEAGAGGLVWTPDNIAAYLRDPKGFVPKNKMAFNGLKKQDDIDAVIAYIASHGG
ncbi:MFS transporter [Rhodobacter veldkampii DSM 11550]|uniref:MFS transporter n=1 Tax=Phaeovulum veldkampii DSM 11550 TaxID=1185920 RepID=A0A2T4JGV1_9RHOB|nr:c-type cytochrome [Phaeovulum veldkampii]MBK5947822.1 MFS transporter [Phaeovulum veldkampii DSM 11550]NCU19997.1 c-type cytochrome [Candidatus Falkowbacteria bacterium]PTE17073.1 MFS transporter [Phaeovulum veldkampii DSM 11550]TDQ64610.1 sulfur dehydrogenase subunit SoxD [Phaeovulum veldkampii DSM 11550]